MSTSSTTPQQLVDRALARSTADDCVVIVEDSGTANLRWATNTLTTNGVTQATAVTVVSMVKGADGVAAAGLTRDATTWAQVEALVADADAAAGDAEAAEDAAALVGGDADPTWEDEPVGTSIEVFAALAAGLGAAFGRAGGDDRLLYGFVEHDVTTTYLGTSTGLRRRHVQPSGHIGITGKDTGLSRSAWVGQATRDFTDVDPLALDAELARRLTWAQRHVDLPAGRYDTVLPPTAVSDLMIYAYWTAGARDAHEGRTVFSHPGGGTRVGERLSPQPVRLWSDPALDGFDCEPFVTAASSGSATSVFDNGLPLGATDWVHDGELAALMQSRHSAELTGLPVTPQIGRAHV